MRFTGRTAKVTSFFILFFLVLNAVSASEGVPFESRSFRVTHMVHEDSRFFFSFHSTDPQNPGEITEAVFDDSGTFRFARFRISVVRSITFSSITLDFSPLLHRTLADTYYDYTLQVFLPLTETDRGEITPVVDGHGACTVELVESDSGLDFEKSPGLQTQDFDIADLVITLDDENSMPGMYAGTVTVSFTVKDTL